jgi:hypothetical protein
MKEQVSPLLSTKNFKNNDTIHFTQQQILFTIIKEVGRKTQENLAQASFPTKCFYWSRGRKYLGGPLRR